jgi:hypothetical protein
VTWLPGETKDEAWSKLLHDAAHMPYKGKHEFMHRGYSVRQLPASRVTTRPPERSIKFTSGNNPSR